jgi:hypothetical protein
MAGRRADGLAHGRRSAARARLEGTYLKQQPAVRLLSIAIAVLLALGPGAFHGAAADNLIFITWDGFRWQELFSGAEEGLLTKSAGGVTNEQELKQSFWRDSPRERREILLPFFWGVIAKQGQVFGDPASHAASRVTNGRKFSYPGYNEMFVGFADEAIKSNDKIPNRNINVLEYIHRQAGFQGQVAAFATWDVIPYILNHQRSGFPIQASWTEITDTPLTPGQQQVNDMVRQLPRLWRGNTFDMITIKAAKEYLKKHQPRVLYIGLGETDEWAHARRYDLYLEAAQRSDAFLKDLWGLVQSLPKYQGKTALVLTTDHGRGHGPDWTNHSATTVGAEYVWIAVLGPNIAPLGIRENRETTQSQIAATLAAQVGIQFQTAIPQAAAPLPLSADN